MSDQLETPDGLPAVTATESGRPETLRDRLDRTGWFVSRDAAAIALSVLDALAQSWSRGVLHLRVDPAMIFFDPDDNLRVGGFSIVGNSEPAGVEQTEEHLSRYRSPELSGGGVVDYRSDLYSLGVVLFEMLTDRLPFGRGGASGGRDIQTVVPPALLRSDLPSGMSELVMKLLERDPERRLSDPRDLRDRLTEFLSTETLQSGETGAIIPNEQVDRHELEPALESSLLGDGSIFSTSEQAGGHLLDLIIAAGLETNEPAASSSGDGAYVPADASAESAFGDGDGVYVPDDASPETAFGDGDRAYVPDDALPESAFGDGDRAYVPVHASPESAVTYLDRAFVPDDGLPEATMGAAEGADVPDDAFPADQYKGRLSYDIPSISVIDPPDEFGANERGHLLAVVPPAEVSIGGFGYNLEPRASRGRFSLRWAAVIVLGLMGVTAVVGLERAGGLNRVWSLGASWASSAETDNPAIDGAKMEVVDSSSIPATKQVKGDATSKEPVKPAAKSSERSAAPVKVRRATRRPRRSSVTARKPARPRRGIVRRWSSYNPRYE